MRPHEVLPASLDNAAPDGPRMKAAVVLSAGAPPTFADFPQPVAQDGQCLVSVAASALSQVTRGRASGEHYSASRRFPFVAGIDGAGRRADGSRVYFIMPTPPFGAMAERCVVDASHCIPLPDGIDDITAAAVAIPGMSSWAALTWRARLAKGETVLINGATGTSGRLAVQVARRLGAARVIATGRNAEALAGLRALGADAVVQISDDRAALEQQLLEHFAQGVNVVLDYLWGPSAEAAMIAAAKAGAPAVPIRFVQIGAASSPTLVLPGAALRSSALELMGSGIGSVPFKGLHQSLREVLASAAAGELSCRATPVPLSELAGAWDIERSDSRIVFTI